MKKLKKSSVSLAWLSRAKSATAASARTSGDRLDLVLPRGWPESSGPVYWRWSSRGGQPQSGQATDLHQVPEAARNARAHIWTPAGDTILTTASLPTRSPRKIAQALPFALEDRLLGDPETLHFAYRPESNGNLSVAVTARERLRQWTDTLTQAGIKPIMLCPATLLVPWAFDCWSLVFSENEVLVRTGGASGFVTPLAQASPPPLLVAALQEAVRTQTTPEYLVTFSAPADFPAEAWGSLLQVPVRVETASVWDKQENPSAPLNLLQGQFEQKGQLGRSLRPYFPAAAMLLVWILGNFAVNSFDWWKLRQQHQEYTREMTSLLLSSFPETKTVLDPAAQMQRSIDSLLARTGKRDRDLLPMLAKTATTLRADTRVRLRGVRYADQSLTLELTWPTPSTPDAIRAALEAAGLRAEVLNLTPRAGEVDGRVRLQPMAPRPTPRSPS
jgi:general secretion pathway protein L